MTFRVDAQMMQLLLKVADHRRQPMGVMVREWVEHKLGEEVQLLIVYFPSPVVLLAFLLIHCVELMRDMPISNSKR
ncbi:MAG: hypothetical protein HY711_09605 [Candidatus Melainabacteria bacterium]|nr:hypothetical protein [Candidatus Melainabacteria bacterium]